MWGETIQIEQVLINLLQNACNSSGQADRAAAYVEANAKNEFIEVRVREFGPGIPDDKLDDIFMPFRSSKLNGLGLGLPFAEQ